MKKLNNKGVTTIELIITFSITLILATSIFQTAVSFSEKMTIESNKLQITNYKNIVTREIQSDLIEKGLTNVQVTSNSTNLIHSINFIFNDGSIGTMEIRTDNKNIHEIKYKSDQSKEFELYELPDIGSSEITKNDGSKELIKALSFEYIDITTDNNIFKLKIKLNHPDIEDHYNINIVSPY